MTFRYFTVIHIYFVWHVPLGRFVVINKKIQMAKILMTDPSQRSWAISLIFIIHRTQCSYPVEIF